MKRVSVLYYAALREQRGLSIEVVHTDAETPLALYEELKRKHGLTLPTSILRCALNDEFLPMDAPLSDGDEATFIPPVAGG